MLQRMLCAALLAASACAHAQETTWNFTYQGFLDAETGVFDAARTLTGTFSGRDGNADGIVALDEVTYLTVDGRNYLSSFDGGCVASESPYLSCSVSRFSYARTGELVFNVGYSGHDEFVTSWYGGVRSGDRITFGRSTDMDGWETNYLWTERTAFSITPAPVPEPAMLPMALAGLALVGLARRRAKVSV